MQITDTDWDSINILTALKLIKKTEPVLNPLTLELFTSWWLDLIVNYNFILNKSSRLPQQLSDISDILTLLCKTLLNNLCNKKFDFLLHFLFKLFFYPNYVENWLLWGFCPFPQNILCDHETSYSPENRTLISLWCRETYSRDFT